MSHKAKLAIRRFPQSKCPLLMASVSIPSRGRPSKDADSQAPQMSSGAKQAVKDSGGWTHFVQSYGGKAHDAGDREEARQIAEKMAYYDSQNSKGSSGGGSKGGKGGKK